MANRSFTYTRNVRLPLNLGPALVSSSYADPITITLTASSLTNLQQAKFLTSMVGNAVSDWNSDLGVFTVTGSRANVNTLMSQLVFIPSSNGTWYSTDFTALAKDGTGATVFNDTWSFVGQANNQLSPKPAAPTQVEIVSNFIPTTVNGKVNFGTISGPLPVYDYSVFLTNEDNAAVDMTSRGLLYANSTIGSTQVYVGSFNKTTSTGFYYISPNGKYLLEFTVSGSNATGVNKYELQNGSWLYIANYSLTAGWVLNSDANAAGGRVSNDGSIFSTPSGKLFKFNGSAVSNITPSSITGSTVAAVQHFNVDNPDIELIQATSTTNSALFEVRRSTGSGWGLSHSKTVSFTGTSSTVKYGRSGRFAVMKASNNDYISVRANYDNTTITDAVMFNTANGDTYHISPQEDSIGLLSSTTTIRVRDYNGSTWGSEETVVTTTNIIQFTFLKDKNSIAVLRGTATPFTLEIYTRDKNGAWALGSSSSITGGTSSTWRMWGGVPYDMIRFNLSAAGTATIDRYYTNNQVLFTTAPVEMINAVNKGLFYNKITLGSTTINKANVRVTDISGNELKYITFINKTTVEIPFTVSSLALQTTDAQAGYFSLLDATPGVLALTAVSSTLSQVIGGASDAAPLVLTAVGSNLYLVDQIDVTITSYVPFQSATYTTATY